MLVPILLILGGLVALVAGGELLVRGASGLAAAARISPLVIGLTVVAFGTSAPELAVSLKASLDGETDIAIGNVVGSNIFNVLFILGLSALIVPLLVSSQLIRLDVPLMIAVSVLLLLLGSDGMLGRLEGGVLFSILIVYTVWLVVQCRRETVAVQREYQAEFGEGEGAGRSARGRSLIQLVLIAVGLGLLVLGADWLVDGAVQVARRLGMSELMIGLTIVAAGTSLPEVAASVLASIRGHRDIAVGNVVGSNIFNICSVLGLTALVAPRGVPVSATALQFDIPVMVAVALACLPIFFTGHAIARWEGGLFFAYYCAYTAYLILAVTNAEAGDTMGLVMLGFVLPLTVVTLLIGVGRTMIATPRSS